MSAESNILQSFLEDDLLAVPQGDQQNRDSGIGTSSSDITGFLDGALLDFNSYQFDLPLPQDSQQQQQQHQQQQQSQQTQPSSQHQQQQTQQQSLHSHRYPSATSPLSQPSQDGDPHQHQQHYPHSHQHQHQHQHQEQQHQQQQQQQWQIFSTETSPAAPPPPHSVQPQQHHPHRPIQNVQTSPNYTHYLYQQAPTRPTTIYHNRPQSSSTYPPYYSPVSTMLSTPSNLALPSSMQNGFYPPPQRNYYTYAPAKPDHRQKRKNVELENGSPIDLLPPKKKSKAKKKKIKEPEDPNAPPKPKRKTGLNKPLILSTALSAVMDGDTELSRPELVKKLWKYIKEHELQDPVDRRYILCDEKLKLVFGGQDRVNSFTMNRDLSAHLTKKTEGQKDTSVSPALTADTPDDIVVTPKEGEVIQSSMSSS